MARDKADAPAAAVANAPVDAAAVDAAPAVAVAAWDSKLSPAPERALKKIGQILLLEAKKSRKLDR